MSSLKMTFSLASLVILFAMVFVPTSVMAAAGGPTVTISDAGTAETPSTRDMFLLKFTFSTSVTGFTSGPADDATLQLYDKNEDLIGTATEITPVAVDGKPREYTATINVSSTTGDPVGFLVTVIADEATGNIVTNNLGIQGNSKTFDLPPLVADGKMVLSLAKADPQDDTTDGKDYVLTATYTDAEDMADTPNPVLEVSHLTFSPAYLELPLLNGATTLASATAGVYTVDLVHPTGAPDVTIGVQPSYIKGVKSVLVPPAPAPDPPTVAITVTDHVPAERSFRVNVALTPVAGSDDIKDFALADLDIEDADEVKLDFTLVAGTLVAERATTNGYTAILKYGLLDKLPLTVTTHKDYKVANTVAPTAYVGDPPPVVDPPVVDPPVVDPPVVDPPVVDPPVVTPPVVTPPVVTPPVTPPVTTGYRFMANTVDGMTFASKAGTSISVGTGTDAVAYIQLPEATGGSGDYDYTLHEGPGRTDVTDDANGLSVDGTSLQLSGKPTTADATGSTGTTYYWRATDNLDNAITELSFTVTVAPADAVLVTDPLIPITLTIGSDVKSLTQDGSIMIAGERQYWIDGEIGPRTGGIELGKLTATANFNPWSVLNGRSHNGNDSYQGRDNEWRFVGDVEATTGHYELRVRDRSKYKLQVSDDPTTVASDDAIAIYRLYVRVDRLGPTLRDVRVSDGVLPEAGGQFRVTLSFDEPLSATPTAAGFSVDNGAISDIIRITGSQYSAIITPNAGVAAGATDATKRTVEVRLKAGLMDEHGNSSIATAATATADGSFSPRKAKRTGPPLSDLVSTEGKLTGLSVPAKSYIIVARTSTPVGLPAAAILPAGTGGTKATINAWSTMPDLEDLFVRGGTLLLTTVKADKLDRDGKADTADEEAKHLDVLITEVMAAVNEAQVGTSDYATHQWIEIYNKLPVDVTVTLTAKQGTPAPDAAATEIRLDRLSNVAISGLSRGWEFTSLGANGVVDDVEADTVDQTPNEPFASFHRNNLGKPGHQKARWSTSTRTYVANADGIHRGSPGGSDRKVNIELTLTNIPSDPFVINEVSTGGDWFELKNVSAEDESLKDYQFSQVTAADTDTRLVSFKGKDYKVPAGEVILIVSGQANSDIPLASVLAGGVNVATPAKDRDKNGSPALYWRPGTFDIKAGESLFILRKNHEDKHLKTANEIVDITGGISITKDQSLVWPIVNTTKPHDKVIAGGKAFSDGKVYYRGKTKGDSFAEAAWNQAVFTGLGYKRKVTNEAQYYGSPGFIDNAAQENRSGLAASDTVTISEIMYDTGAGNQSLPQWIELYNSSMTQSVNLDGWKLALENYADEVVSTFNATITFEGGKIIPPNQTVLLVSGSRGQVADPQRYLATRVINLYLTKAYRDELELTKRTDQVLSKTGFYLKLTDKAGVTADEVGNIDGDRRTRDPETKWDLPTNGEDRRSSIIRIYAGLNTDLLGLRGTGSKNMKVDGQLAEGWVLASKTDFARVNAPAYYGDPDDSGTPGFRTGGPLPVSLSKFRPERLDSGEIVVRWITESELNNAGFNILRSETRDGQFTKMNTSLIAGQGTTSERTTYEWKDSTAKPSVVYYYQIQDVSLDGKVQTLRQSRLKGNVTAAGKLTTTWGELKALQ